ncbi:hypothetical protein M9458_026901, partial [Cirrhinus mrigala]
GLFLQSSACAGAPGVRDSGYDSLRRRISIVDRLMQTHSVWKPDVFCSRSRQG